MRSRPSPRTPPRMRLTRHLRRARSRGRSPTTRTSRVRAGRRPVGMSSPRCRLKIRSVSTAASVVAPVGAEISRTRRVPSRSMPRCTTRSMQLATVGTTKAESMLRPARSGSVQSFTSASCAELAWIVHMPGSPEFRAMSRSRLSASRTSPTTRRSGRIRSASLMRRRRVISPVPSRLGWRHCMDTRSRTSRSSSNVSSTVTTRSSLRAADMSALSIVVLPVWVAPDTRMFAPASTLMRRNSAAWRVSESSSTSCVSERMLRRNLRMFTAQCARVTSGMATCRREPSGSDASTNGEERSTRRPECCSIRSTSSRTSRSDSTTVVSSGTPSRATNTRVGELIQISSTVGSSKNGCSGP